MYILSVRSSIFTTQDGKIISGYMIKVLQEDRNYKGRNSVGLSVIDVWISGYSDVLESILEIGITKMIPCKLISLTAKKYNGKLKFKAEGVALL